MRMNWKATVAAVALTARLGRALSILQGEGSDIATEPLGDGRVRVGGTVADHPGPPVLDLTEVPQQVVGDPLRAARDGGLRVAGGQRVAEPLGLLADVPAVGLGVESRHASRT